jgi:hypothetical protein
MAMGAFLGAFLGAFEISVFEKSFIFNQLWAECGSSSGTIAFQVLIAIFACCLNNTFLDVTSAS